MERITLRGVITGIDKRDVKQRCLVHGLLTTVRQDDSELLGASKGKKLTRLIPGNTGNSDQPAAYAPLVRWPERQLSLPAAIGLRDPDISRARKGDVCVV